MPDLCAYLISRLLRLKIKYENIFNEKLNIYNNIIEKTIGNVKGDIIYDNLKNIGKECDYDINPLTSPGEGVTVFTSPYLSAGAPALGEAKG